MPDEVVFTAGAKSTPPAGTKIATDTVGGKEIQFVKLDLGGDGIASPVSDAIPVYDISGTTVNVNVTVSGTSIQYVTGTVSVQNFPLVQDVAIVSGTIAFVPPIQQGISGSVSVNNWPIQQGVSGTVGVVKRYLTPLAPTGTAIGLSSALVVSANTNRTGLALVNASSGWVSLGLGTTATLYAGVTLSPNGGVFEMDEYMFCSSAIYGIASITGTVLAIQEFI